MHGGRLPHIPGKDDGGARPAGTLDAAWRGDHAALAARARGRQVGSWAVGFDLGNASFWATLTVGDDAIELREEYLQVEGAAGKGGDGGMATFADPIQAELEM